MLELKTVGDFHVPSLLTLLAGVGRLPTGVTGALVFRVETDVCGTILVESGKVCWAATPLIGQRLTDIIAKTMASDSDRRSLEAIFKRCQKSRRPLGEMLLKSGLLTEVQLRASLLQHTAEAVGALSLVKNRTPSWSPNPRRRYDAQFSFSAVDILTAIGALGKVRTAGTARRILRECVGETGMGIAFPARESNAELPFAHVRSRGFDVPELMEIGEWARPLGSGAKRIIGWSLRSWEQAGIVFIHAHPES